MTARFAPGIEIPLRPFFGSMGVGATGEPGADHSVPPWFHAGNIDNKEFVAGTTLFIPLHARGALFQVGDGHAGQGNGEVDTGEAYTVGGQMRIVQVLWREPGGFGTGGLSYRSPCCRGSTVAPCRRETHSANRTA